MPGPEFSELVQQQHAARIEEERAAAIAHSEAVRASWQEHNQRLADEQRAVWANFEQQYFTDAIQVDAVEAARHLYYEPRTLDIVMGKVREPVSAWAVAIRGVSANEKAQQRYLPGHTVGATILSSDGRLLEVHPVPTKAKDYPLASNEAILQTISKRGRFVKPVVIKDAADYHEQRERLAGIVAGRPATRIN